MTFSEDWFVFIIPGLAYVGLALVLAEEKVRATILTFARENPIIGGTTAVALAYIFGLTVNTLVMRGARPLVDLVFPPILSQLESPTSPAILFLLQHGSEDLLDHIKSSYLHMVFLRSLVIVGGVSILVVVLRYYGVRINWFGKISAGVILLILICLIWEWSFERRSYEGLRMGSVQTVRGLDSLQTNYNPAPR